ncbi:hypothetical protein WM16_04705 [Burkholderia ubonensis]|uniref:Uncharacterized protein n=1 Tax=Burkholderia ubonensis TaxID=101571 RepID=A0A108CTX4_9BURK|nr:hypothetical protein [Burkholderia ubonensis]KWK80569.1 hypothetical protein WM16_04705 [Burkholderia ubonensis]
MSSVSSCAITRFPASRPPSTGSATPVMIRAAGASDFALLISPAFAALYAGWPSAWTPFTEPMIAIAPRRAGARRERSNVARRSWKMGCRRR